MKAYTFNTQAVFRNTNTVHIISNPLVAQHTYLREVGGGAWPEHSAVDYLYTTLSLGLMTVFSFKFLAHPLHSLQFQVGSMGRLHANTGLDGHCHCQSCSVIAPSALLFESMTVPVHGGNHTFECYFQ